ncbi:hypothetical protein PT300_11370 [Enterobacteriaceae bacterium ESL0689]|nr:hypothetical protein [Enterobacteriaceae bacterium ESL0689]
MQTSKKMTGAVFLLFLILFISGCSAEKSEKSSPPACSTRSAHIICDWNNVSGNWDTVTDDDIE